MVPHPLGESYGQLEDWTGELPGLESLAAIGEFAATAVPEQWDGRGVHECDDSAEATGPMDRE